MMQIARHLPPLLFFFHAVYYVSFASAAPVQWFKRRDCESLVCPSDWDIVPLINGAVGGFLYWLLPGDPPGPEVGKPTTATPTQSEPDTELRVWVPPSKECNVWVPDRKSQTGFENPHPCQKSIAHTVWPRDCANALGNKATADVLITLDPKFLTSKHPDCTVKGGVYFWLAILTPEQVQFLTIWSTSTVDAVVPNMPWKKRQVVSARPIAAGTPVTSQKKSRSLWKRETVQAPESAFIQLKEWIQTTLSCKLFSVQRGGEDLRNWRPDGDSTSDGNVPPPGQW